jgi:hypothetical protein
MEEMLHSNIIDGVGLENINKNIRNIFGPNDEERCPIYGAVISALVSDETPGFSFLSRIFKEKCSYIIGF